MKKRVNVYLDTSVFNRPFDDQNQTRIRLEAEAFLSILEKAVSGAITIIGSSTLHYENSRNPLVERKERVSSYLNIASKIVVVSDNVIVRAVSLEHAGIEPIDALHLACAESGGAEYFVTCDDNIIKKARKDQAMVQMAVCGPLEFVLKEVFKNA